LETKVDMCADTKLKVENFFHRLKDCYNVSSPLFWDLKRYKFTDVSEEHTAPYLGPQRKPSRCPFFFVFSSTSMFLISYTVLSATIY
jgi:hypothetical protein